MAALEQVVVADAGLDTAGLGVLRSFVVDLERGVQRQLVLHLQFHVHAAGPVARGDDGRDLAVAAGARQFRQLFLHLVEVGHHTGREVGQRAAYPAGQRELRAGDAQLLDRRLHHLQAQFAARIAHALRRQYDIDAQETGVLVGFLQRPAGALGIGGAALRTQEAIHGAFDGGGAEHAVTLHDKLENVETGLFRRASGCLRAGAAAGPTQGQKECAHYGLAVGRHFRSAQIKNSPARGPKGEKPPASAGGKACTIAP